MKNLLFLRGGLLLAVLLIPRALPALTFGLKGGLNLAARTDPKVIPAEYGPRLDFVVGGFTAFRLSGRLSLQSEILYSREGNRSTDTYYWEEIRNQWKSSYLKAPVLLRYRFGPAERPGLSVLAGPYLSVQLSSRRIQTGFGAAAEEDITSEVFPLDYGIILGAAYESALGKGWLSVELRAGIGLANTIFKGGYNDWVDPPEDPAASRNRTISVLLGYAFTTRRTR